MAKKPRAGSGPVADGAPGDPGHPDPGDPDRHRRRLSRGGGPASACRVQPDPAGQARGQEVDELPERAWLDGAGDYRDRAVSDRLRPLARRPGLARERFFRRLAHEDVTRT